jgi:predicted enzyme related to lactoylglutathione lyase
VSASETTGVDAATIKGVDLFGYLVDDPDRTVAFYRDVLGMTPTEIDKEGRGAEFTLPDGSTFGVWKADEGQKAMATVMFAVDDLPAALERFRSLGAKLSDPIESPVCFMAFGEDPDGNGIVIHRRKVRD